MVAMPVSSILTPGAITSPRPGSWRWAITTARRGGRGINNPGSRPFGARASPPGWAVTSIGPANRRGYVPELFPTRMRGTAVAFCFNAPRWISCVGPLIAGTLIVRLGGYGPAATLVGLFFILGVVAAPFLPETRGKPLPETVSPPLAAGASPTR